MNTRMANLPKRTIMANLPIGNALPCEFENGELADINSKLGELAGINWGLGDLAV
jgi:hypothetical protein